MLRCFAASLGSNGTPPGAPSQRHGHTKSQDAALLTLDLDLVGWTTQPFNSLMRLAQAFQLVPNPLPAATTAFPWRDAVAEGYSLCEGMPSQEALHERSKDPCEQDYKAQMLSFNQCANSMAFKCWK